jgi:chromosome segregation ATPase
MSYSFLQELHDSQAQCANLEQQLQSLKDRAISDERRLSESDGARAALVDKVRVLEKNVTDLDIYSKSAEAMLESSAAETARLVAALASGTAEKAHMASISGSLSEAQQAAQHMVPPIVPFSRYPLLHFRILFDRTGTLFS